MLRLGLGPGHPAARGACASPARTGRIGTAGYIGAEDGGRLRLAPPAPAACHCLRVAVGLLPWPRVSAGFAIHAGANMQEGDGREKVGENCQIPAAGLQSQGDCCENVGYDSCYTFLQDYQDVLTHQLSLMLTCDPGVNLKQAAFFKEYTLLSNCVVSTGRTATFQHMSHLVLFKGIQSPPVSVLRSPSPSQPEPLMP